MEVNNVRPSLLIVDDEPDILFMLKNCFSEKEYRVETAENGRKAIEKLKTIPFHLVILDLNMVPVTGLEVLKFLRKENQETVVIILTAYSTLDSAIEAIHLGAFDYLVKPAEISHIRRRVSEGLKQYEKNHLLELHQSDPPEKDGKAIHAGNLTLNPSLRTAVYDGKSLDLTTMEFKILFCLINAAPHPVSPVQIVKTAMGYDCSPIESAGIVKFHIHQLRQKLEPDSLKPQHIKTVRFEGYLWCD